MLRQDRTATTRTWILLDQNDDAANSYSGEFARGNTIKGCYDVAFCGGSLPELR